MPRSLSGRLLVTASLALLVALAVAGFGIAHMLERFVIHGLDERLDAQIMVVSRAVRPDGTIDRGAVVDVPPFDEAASGWAWELRGARGVLRSASLGSADIVVPDHDRHGPPHVDPFGPDTGRPRPFDGRDPNGQRVHGRVLRLPSGRGAVTIIAVGPREVVERPLRAALLPLLGSLLLLGAALAIAILVQLRFGLRPLATLRVMVDEVRDGKRRHLGATEPTELLPLVAALNTLIDANEIALAQARGHVANLAHGLKTPLAALRLDLAAPGRDPGGRLAAQVERIDRHVRHHLGRARAATPAGSPGAATPVGAHVDDLVAALGRIHADRPVRAVVAVPRDLAVRCDPQDLDEMLGNLLDNGWRWARSALRISAERAGGMVRIAIADDGPGLAADDLARVLQPGVRLDERVDGHGFGLSITRELAELYGGRLELDVGMAGGVVATIALPAS